MDKSRSDRESARRARLTRRRILRTGVTASAGALGLALTGCGGGGDSDSQGTSQGASQGAPATPRKGGVLNVGQVKDIVLNTGLPQPGSISTGTFAPLVFEPLIRYRDSLKPTLWMVDQYELSPDFTSVTARLKPDLVFHDGSKVTPEDVFFGIELMRDPSKFGVAGAFQLAAFARPIKEYKANDERTLVFTLDQPRPNIND